jgi:hypothetical protein
MIAAKIACRDNELHARGRLPAANRGVDGSQRRKLAISTEWESLHCANRSAGISGVAGLALGDSDGKERQ